MGIRFSFICNCYWFITLGTRTRTTFNIACNVAYINVWHEFCVLPVSKWCSVYMFEHLYVQWNLWEKPREGLLKTGPNCLWGVVLWVPLTSKINVWCCCKVVFILFWGGLNSEVVTKRGSTVYSSLSSDCLNWVWLYCLVLPLICSCTVLLYMCVGCPSSCDLFPNCTAVVR